MIDEEREQFERSYRRAMAEASENMDLTAVLDVLRNYQRIAALTRRQGVAAHRRMLDKAAAIQATGGNPDGVPIERVRAIVDQRLGT